MPQPVNPIRTLRLARGLSLQQLAEAAGTSKSQIDKLEKGVRRLTVDWMVRLAKPLGCDPRDLIPASSTGHPTGVIPAKAGIQRPASAGHVSQKQKMQTKSAGLFPQTAHRHAPLDSRLRGNDARRATLPVLSAARGGKDQEMFLADGPIDQTPRPPYLEHVKDAYAIYVTGNSMTPMYRPRQLLFVHPYKPPSPGSGVVIIKKNGAVLIKEFVKQKKSGITVREYNPRRRDFTIPMAEVETVHAVVGAQEPG
ncbi:MAG: S24 family peptidase [Alphaproteobacteria bacterium]|nr:S24 family peptidase [Alphaproteobacteria bacterium]